MVVTRWIVAFGDSAILGGCVIAHICFLFPLCNSNICGIFDIITLLSTLFHVIIPDWMTSMGSSFLRHRVKCPIHQMRHFDIMMIFFSSLKDRTYLYVSRIRGNRVFISFLHGQLVSSGQPRSI